MKNESNHILDRIKSIKNTEIYLLEELRSAVGYGGSLQCFRVLCWRNKIPYTQNYGRKSLNLDKLRADGYDFANKTIQEIKEVLEYKGGFAGLKGLLKRNNIDCKPSPTGEPANKEFILRKIHSLGDTSNMRPREILARVGFETMNPSQYLAREQVPYKPKRKKVEQILSIQE